MAQSKAQTQKNAVRGNACGIPCPLLGAQSSKEKSTMGSHLPRFPGRQLMFALGIEPIGSLLTEIRRGEVRKGNQKTHTSGFILVTTRQMELTHGAIESPDPGKRSKRGMGGIPCPLLRAQSSKEKTTMGSHFPRSPGRQLSFALGIEPIGALLTEIRRTKV